MGECCASRSRGVCLRRLDGEAYFYAVFDVQDGSFDADYADLAVRKVCDEITSEKLSGERSDEYVKDLLRDAIIGVESAYAEFVRELIAERISIQTYLTENCKDDKTSQKYTDAQERSKSIDEKLSVGLTSVIAVICNEKLYVANIGNSRALLCKTDDNCVLRVVQLSVDHSLKNEDELLRLSQLGVDINFIRNTFGSLYSTRCLGNYFIKTFYNNVSGLSGATEKPIIADPEVHGPINLDESCRFLVLMNDMLYKNLQEAVDTEQVNKQLAQMIVEQFRIQPSLEAVCRAVVNKISSLYREYNSETSPLCDDSYTLMIRNFNFLLPNSVNAKPSIKSLHENKVRFNPVVQSQSPSTINESDVEMSTIDSTDLTDHNGTDDSGQSGISTITSQFSQNSNFPNYSLASYPTGGDNRCINRIKPYVDFTGYYESIGRSKQNGSL